MLAWGIAPGTDFRGVQALKAQFSQRLPLNPKHTARRNQCRICAIVRGIPPESSECDDALVARQRIGA